MRPLPGSWTRHSTACGKSSNEAVALAPAFVRGAARDDGVIIGGLLLGIAICDPHGTGPIEGPPPLMWAWLLIPGTFLVLFGLRRQRQALYVFAVIPIPVFIASGLYVRMTDPKSWLPGMLFLLGLAVPIVSGRLITAYYRRTSFNK